LIDNGVLQQYDAPLDVYSRPNSLFVADFVGNPAINFIEAAGKQRADGDIELSLLGGKSAVFHPKQPLDLAKWYADEDAKDADKKTREAELAKDKKHVEKANKDTVFRCHIPMVTETEDFGDDAEPADGDFIVGVRPGVPQAEHGRPRGRDIQRHAHRHGDHRPDQDRRLSAHRRRVRRRALPHRRESAYGL
ncbi:MAG: hypothetical protein ACLUEK_05300, partial [Oscillospiraceae bacterium]